MTTLQAIGFTVAGGSVVFFLSLFAFGIAVRRQSQYVAPRCAARPRKVIYNPKPQNSVQDRGTAILGWVRWSMNLTYDTMLMGVPGTGTRKQGLEGSMLRCNLDGIVLIRFNGKKGTDVGARYEASPFSVFMRVNHLMTVAKKLSFILSHDRIMFSNNQGRDSAVFGLDSSNEYHSTVL